MGVRLQGDFYSQDQNDKYTIEVHDSTYSGTVYDFKLVALDWNYQGLSKDRFNPILTSTMTFGLVVENTNISVFTTDLIGAAEERFRIKVLKNDNNYWFGHILLDLTAYEDAPVDADAPPIYTITATDGLGRLKKIDYNDNGTAYSGKQTFLQHIYNCLDKINLDDLYGTDDEYFYSICLWYETQQTENAQTDPLTNAQFDHRVFVSIDQQTVKTYHSCWEVLTAICTAWGARLMHSDGKYRFTQVNEHEKSNYNAINRYKKDQSALSDSLAVNHTKTLDTDIYKIRGGTRY